MADDFGASDWRERLAGLYDVAKAAMAAAYRSYLRDDYIPRARDVRATLGRDFASDDVAAVFGSATWLAFRASVSAGMQRYADGAYLGTLQALEGDAVALGIEAAEALALAAAGDAAPVVRSQWQTQTPAAVSGLSSPVLLAMLAGFGADAAANLEAAAVAGFAQKGFAGLGSVLGSWPAIPLSWSATGSRTAQAWAYRRASHATYRANRQLIRGWVWVATLDKRVCVSCLSMHGTRHSVDEVLNDHHNGRCTPVPIVIGSDLTSSISSSQNWFDRQPRATQLEIMGPGRLKAYREGRFVWADMSRTYTDAIYGVMRRAATLKELLGK